MVSKKSVNVIGKCLSACVVIGITSGLTGCSTTMRGPKVDAFIKMRWPSNGTLAADQSFYFVHNPDGIRQLYKKTPGQHSSKAIKLTSFTDGVGGYSISHDGKWIGITAATGGSEQADLFLMNAASGKMETLFGDPKVVYGGPIWRRDSNAFAYRANDESPSDFHVYLYDLNSRSHKKVMSGKGYYYPADFSSDGKKLLVGKYNSATHSQVFEVDLATGESREVTPKNEKWSFGAIGYLPGDDEILVATDYHGDLKQVYKLSLSSGKLEPCLSELADYQVDLAGFDLDRKILAVGTNRDGYRNLHLYETSGFSKMSIPPMTKGLVGNVQFQGSQMLYSLSNANTPGVIYRWNMKEPGAAPVAMTEVDTQGIDVSQFRLPELVHYPSFDGKKIPAFLYVPNDYREGKKIPFLVYYHGGPEGQFRPGFTRSFQYFLSQGFGILAPNVRGSSGYGKEYIEADNYKNRHKSVKDGIWAAKYLIDEGYSKEKMIGSWGGSYGGFMVMATITEAPEIFGAACNVVGVVNFKTFLEQTKSYRRKLREVEYGPLSDPEFLESISPIRKIDRVEAPLMLAHGLNDPRVPVGEAMQIAIALKKRGKEVEELYFPDEGHGFAKEENNLLYYQQLAKFFQKHLQ